MTHSDRLVKLLGQEVTVTNHLGMVMASGTLVGLQDEPTVLVRDTAGRDSSWPQSFRIEPDLTADARRVVAYIEKYEEEHGHHDDGWPCLADALTKAREAVTKRAGVRICNNADQHLPDCNCGNRP